MKILGLRSAGGIPILEVLCLAYDNSGHENHIEIARRYWRVEPGKFKAIVLIYGEGENHMSIYTQADFTR